MSGPTIIEPKSMDEKHKSDLNKNDEPTFIEELEKDIDWGKYRTVPEYRNRVEMMCSSDEISEMRKVAKEKKDTQVEIDEMSMDEVWEELEAEHREKVLKPFIQEEFEKRKDNMEVPDWALDDKETKPVKELSGNQFKELMREAQTQEVSTEELSEAEEIVDNVEEPPEVDHIEINETTEELSEEAIDGFSERAKNLGKSYWSDTVEELEMEQKAPSPTSISHRDSDTLEIRTGNSEFAQELRQDSDTKIERDNGDHIIAVASKETHGLN